MKYTFTKSATKNVDANFYLIFKDYKNDAISNDALNIFEKIINKNNFKFNNTNSKTIYSENISDTFISLCEDKNKLTLEMLKKSLSQIFKLAKTDNLKKIGIYVQENNFDKIHILKTIIEMYKYHSYDFDKFLSNKNPLNIEKIEIIGNYSENDICYVNEADYLGEMINKVRSLIDEPSNNLYPESFVNTTKEIFDNKNIEINVYDKEYCEKLGMNCFLAVSQGSIREPKLLVMKYTGNKDSKEILGLVGKGVTYDSGGYSIKTSGGMVTMKADMSGAATVVGTINAIANANLKINVVAVCALCENLISDRSYKPGDIFKSMNGKTVFIGNTDAEGRLTLIDAITYAIREEKVTKLIDIATLTGAAVHALGTLCSAVMTNNQSFIDKFIKASEYSCEYAWQMPMLDVYRKDIKHHEADLVNTVSGVSGSPGTITAGMFLEEVVEEKDWIHVDFAGPAFLNSPKSFYNKGATGHSVKTLYELAKMLEEN